MGNISNRFYVTALEDGTTLHGNLVSDKSLVQGWNGNSASPNWTIAENQPTIHLTLLSGNTQVEPSNTYKWYYNGGEIVFDGNNQSTAANGVPAGVFLKTTFTIDQLSMPALKIIGNLASSNNVDIDVIEFRGQYVINGTGVDFACNIQVRISTVNAEGFLGVINFHNGIGDITSAGQTITLYGVLYGGGSGQPVPNIGTKWYLNESTTPTIGTTIEGHPNAFSVNEADVVDHATVRCEFYDGQELKYTAYTSIDDMQDPQFMYIQYAGKNGNAASLRKNESVTFSIWVGTRDNQDVLGGQTPEFNTIKVKLLDGEGNTITDPLRHSQEDYIPDADSNGWRILPTSLGKASVKVWYDYASDYGKNITGIVMASTAP